MFVIIFGIVGIVFFIISNYADDYKNCERLGTLGAICIVCAFFSIFTLVAPNKYEDKRTFVSSTEIIAVTDDESVFVLEADQTISFSTINQMLKKEIISLSKEDCAIIEEADCTMPRIEMYERKIEKEWYYLFADDPKIEYVIYVPAGSVSD